MDKKSATSIVLSGVFREGLSQVPGGNTAFDLVRKAISARAERRAIEIFTAIAVDLGVSDWEAAAQKMAEHSGKSWFDENIEAGFLELMDCMNEDARLCIGFLVSEYVINERSPNLNFRRVGSLLRDCDKSILSALKSISGQYVSVANRSRDGLRVLIQGRRGEAGSDSFRVCAYTDDEEEPLFSDRVTASGAFIEAVRLLKNNSFGNSWSGFSSDRFKGNPVLRFEIEEDARMRLLHRCAVSWSKLEREDATQSGNQEDCSPGSQTT